MEARFVWATWLSVIGLAVIGVMVWAAVDESPQGIFTEAVKRQARDPGSVRVRNVREVENGICGQVNSRNGFGALTGYQTIFAERQVGDYYRVTTDEATVLRECYFS